MFTKRQLKILDLLLKNSNGITGTTIADLLNISSRTVRNDISAINSIFKEKKFKVGSSKQKGYFIDSDNIECIKDMISILEDRHSDTIENDERIFIILDKILFNTKQSIYDLADELYISEQLVYKDFNKLKKILSNNYNYEYLKISGEYIENTASEENIRKLLFQILKDYVSSNKMKNIKNLLCGYFEDEVFEKLYYIIKKFFEVHKINIDDKSMDMIVGSIYMYYKK